MESPNTGVQRIVKREKLYQDGLVIEEPQELERSMMLPEYRQAAVMVSEIVQRSDSLKSSHDGTTVNNIISFVGDRGTGKTSVMRSFKEFLKNTKSNKNASLFQGEEKWDLPEEICFVTLRYIDASILKSSEDVMVIILARMFRYVRDQLETPTSYGLPVADQEETRSLFRKFEQVYESIMTLNEKRPFREGESALQRIQSVNSSSSLADNFRYLVKEFLKFAADREGADRRRPYLVIALDDVDRYMPDTQSGELQKDVYTLLGQIDEYLKIPGVIVLLAYDEALLKRTCMIHIKQKFQLNKDMAQRQVSQYLTKIIPSQQKVYMPNLGRVDHGTYAQLQVEISPEVTLTAKQLTLGYLASQYGCFFDGQGNKKHFFEERNLRKLSDLLLALELSDQEKESGQGYKKLSNYTYSRLINFILDAKEAALFSEWLEEPIERTGWDILEYIQTEVDKHQIGRLYLTHSKPGENWGYGYGELMYNIHLASSTEEILSENMLQSILLNYSITLPDLFRRGDRDSIKRVLGSSIAGQWANDILPTFFVNNNEATKRMERGRVGAYNIKDGFDTIFRLSYTKTADAGKFELRDFIQAVELMGMFFTTVQKDGSPSDLSLALERMFDQGWAGDIDFVLGSQADSACFNMFNFVLNSYNWEEYFEQLHKSLAGVVERKVLEETNYMNASDNLLDLAIDEKKPDGVALLRKYSLKNQFKKWSEDFGGLAMPVQHFDMMYNIMRRQQDDRSHGLKVEASPTEFLNCCKIVYQNVLNALREQDQFYISSWRGDEPFVSFGDAFWNCPFIQFILVKKKSCVFELLKYWTGQLVNRLLVRMADDSFLKPNG